VVEGVEPVSQRLGADVTPRESPAAEGTTRRRVLAVDGGQSTIRIACSEVEDRVDTAGVSRAPSSDDRLAGIIRRAWESFGRPIIDRAVLGLTTAPADPVRAHALGARIASMTGAPEVWICDDAVTSHAGGLSLGWGVSVTAGTGVASLAVSGHGVPRIIGGFGYLLGDEGGAFWIGREGLRAVLRAAEDRGPATTLAGLAVGRYGRLDGLPVRLHDTSRRVEAIAAFAVDVLEAAHRDGVAATIVQDAATELHAVVRAGASIARGHDAIRRVPVALGGRLLDHATPLRIALDARLDDDGTVDARTADHSPLDGAFLLGAQATPGRYSPLVNVWPGREA
jgi:N-acetylglucosamine kinase-like BadF-type ATPase